MIEILVVLFILIVLLLSPLWVFYRMVVSRETRSHLNALLLHDIIKITLSALAGLITGAFRLLGRTLSLTITGIRRLLP
jgi:hypothetical protein